MKHLFKPNVVKALWTLLILALVVKVLWFLLEMLWLPASGVDHVEERGNNALYYRVKLSPNTAPAPVATRPVNKKSTVRGGSIKDIKLLAIYHASDITVVTVVYKAKSKVLSTGDEINGFVLEGAGQNYATFSKKSKTYQITLLKGKKSKDSIVPGKSSSSPSSKSSKKTKAEGDIVDAGDHRIIDKSLLDHYATNMDDIYKNIGIKEIKKGKAIEGFSISFIRKGSPFAKLGLKRGDVIKSMNGQKLDNYNAAFGMYKNIQNINNLTLVIERGKEEMELEYEVN